MTTEVNETVPEDVVSEYVAFLVRLVRLPRNRLFGLYFAPQCPKRVETAWEGFSEAP